MLGLNHPGQQICLRLTEPNDRGGNLIGFKGWILKNLWLFKKKPLKQCASAMGVGVKVMCT